jgi:hypothetical protein
MALVLGMKSELKLDSRCENQITNVTNRCARIPGEELAVDDLARKHPHAIHRTRSSRKYNCHGLVFASRRTEIWDSAEVAKIILEDDYVKVPFEEVLVGDVAVYVDNGDMQHSGIVVEMAKNPKMARILGKWGHLQEVVHWANDAPPEYGMNIEYYTVTS